MSSIEVQVSLPENEQALSLAITKMHGLGNDFVMLEDIELAKYLAQIQAGDQTESFLASVSRLARQICNRRTGVGGDGMIVCLATGSIEKLFSSEAAAYFAAFPELASADLTWLYVNSDGSYSDMCGNGLRCLARFAQLRGYVRESTFRIATRVYPVDIRVSLLDTVTTVLFPPQFAPQSVPIDCESEFLAREIAIEGSFLRATAVSMGNPHIVIFSRSGEHGEGEINWLEYPVDIEGGATLSGEPGDEKNHGTLLSLATEIQSMPLFPQGVNVEFALIENNETVRVYVVERGCGPTLACASGAAAVVAAGVREGLLKRQSRVILPGGTLFVNWLDSEMGDKIELTGPAKFVFEGHYCFSNSLAIADCKPACPDSGVSGV